MSRASSPGVSRKRAAEGAMRQNLKHLRTDSSVSVSSDTAVRLAAQLKDATAGDAPSPRARSAKARSTAGESRAEDVATTRGDEDDSAVDSDIDEADFGQQTLEREQESAAEKARLRILLESFDRDQMNRYEVFRRAGLNKISLKKLANAVTGQTVSQNVTVVVAGAAKVFVGEIVEEALQVQQRRGGQGSLLPDDLREAYRNYTSQHTTVAHVGRQGRKRAALR